MRQRTLFLLILLAGSDPASGQSAPCIPDFGDRRFMFAGDSVHVISGAVPGCNAGQGLVFSTLTVTPEPPSGAPALDSAEWQTARGDEGDYFVQGDWQCNEGPPYSNSFPMTVLTRLVVVGAETTQGVNDAFSAGALNLAPGRETIVRLYVENDSAAPGNPALPSVSYAPVLRAFGPITPPGQPAQCVELPDSPQQPMNSRVTHLAAPNALARRGDWKSSLNFRLRPEWVQPGNSFRVEAADGRPLFSLASTAGDSTPDFWSTALPIPPEGPPNPDGTSSANLDLRLLAIPWVDVQGFTHVPTLDQMLAEARRLHASTPFPKLDKNVFFFPAKGLNLPAQPQNADVERLLLDALDQLHLYRFLQYLLRWQVIAVTPPAYYGVLADYPLQLGIVGAARPGSVGVGFNVDNGSVAAHEVAHILGVLHAGHSSFGNGPACRQPCPAGQKAGPCCSCTPVGEFDFPNINTVGGRSVATLGLRSPAEISRSAIWGLDMFPAGKGDPLPLSPEKYFELMSYCGKAYGADGKWPSDHTWRRLLGSLSFLTDDLPAIGVVPAPVRVYAGRSDGVSVEMAPVFEVSTAVEVGVGAVGALTFRERDGSGVLLQEGLFDAEPAITEEGSTVQSFTFAVAVPVNPDARRAEFLQQGQVVASIDASPNPPTVHVVFPDGGEILPAGDVTFSWTGADADGSALSYWVQLSLDSGSTWESLAVNWPDTSMDVDTRLLPASQNALLRVVASDGFWNASDSSDGEFQIPDDPPHITLLSPPNGNLYSGRQLVSFQVDAYDATDGVMPDPSISWSSNLDGFLGNGLRFALQAEELSVGDHVVTVTATDSGGNAAQAQVNVRVEIFDPMDPATLPLADLAVDLPLPTPAPRVGETVSMEISLHNWGPDAAQDVTLDATLPPIFSVVGAVTTQGTCMSFTTTVNCTLGTLESGTVVTVTVEALGQSEGDGDVVVVIGSSTMDAALWDNQIAPAASVRAATDPDMDGDLFSVAQGDCDDLDPAIHPAAGEICNGMDDNCDGVADESGDLLCFVSAACLAGVCDPLAGCLAIPSDIDGDGFFAPECGGIDCDDSEATVWLAPQTVENLSVAGSAPSQLAWDSQAGTAGPGTAYDVISGTIDSATGGFAWDGVCLATVGGGQFDDFRAAPPVGTADWYLIRSTNPCGDGDPGSPERELNLPICP